MSSPFLPPHTHLHLAPFTNYIWNHFLPVTKIPACSTTAALLPMACYPCQKYLYNIPTLLKELIFLDCLDPHDRGSKLIQNTSNNSTDMVSYTRRLASSKMSLLQYLLICLFSYHASLNVWVVPVFQLNISDTGNRHSWWDVCIPQKNTPCTNGHQTSRTQQPL